MTRSFYNVFKNIGLIIEEIIRNTYAYYNNGFLYEINHDCIDLI